jgi:hypothetical protein
MKANINNIHRIKNFLSKDEIEIFINYINESLFFQKNNEMNVMEAIWYTSPLWEVVKEYKKRLRSSIEFNFGEDVLEITNTCIRKWYPRRISRSPC